MNGQLTMISKKFSGLTRGKGEGGGNEGRQIFLEGRG